MNKRTFYKDEKGQDCFELFEISKVFVNGLTFFDGFTSDPFLLDIVNGFRLKGKLNVGKLEKAIKKAYADIDALRTIYVKNEESAYFQIPDEYDFTLLPIVPEGADAEARYEEAQNMVNANISLRGAFYLPCAARFELYELDANDHLFMIYMNHMFTDGESVKLVVKKVMTDYFGIGLLGKVHKLTMMDYYRDAQQKLLASQEKNEEYWAKEKEGFQLYRFRDPEPYNELEPDEYRLQFDRKELQENARGMHTTLSNALICAFHLALAKVYGLSETMITIAAANRMDKRFWNTVAPMAKTVIHRLPVNPSESMRAYLGTALKKFSENMEHVDASFTTIGVTRFLFDYINLSEPIPPVPGLEMSFWAPDFNVESPEYAMHGVILLIIETEFTIDVNFICRHDIFNKHDLLTLRNQFMRAVACMKENPEITVGETLGE
jgi:hypothetical protein